MTETKPHPNCDRVEVAISRVPADGAPAFEEIYDAEFGYVWHTLRRLGVKAGDLEDLTQDVFVVVHRRLVDFDATRSIRPWLFGIAFRVARDFQRRFFHRHELNTQEKEATSDGPHPDDAVAARQKLRLVEKALHQLDLDKRAVFIMHDIDELSVPEIADSLSIPLNTAYSRLRLARLAFKKTVKSLEQMGVAP